MRHYLGWITLLILGSCAAPENKFSDATIVRIYDLKDKRSADSLQTFFKSTDLVYRREAALAFASVQDSTASTALGNLLLEDSDPEVRVNAAFALGQTGGTQAVNALIPALDDQSNAVVCEVIEALGKTVSKKDFEVLTRFQATDTLLQAGLAWAFYRASLRGFSDSMMTKRSAALLMPENSDETRIAAASFFARSPKQPVGVLENVIITAALSDRLPEVRMMAVSGFRHVSNQTAEKNLPVVLKDSDFRVRINALRASQNFLTNEIKAQIILMLNDSSKMVQVAASEVIRNKSDQFLNEKIEAVVETLDNWRAKANLYGALIKTDLSEVSVNKVIEVYRTSSTYPKSGLLSALGEAKMPANKISFDFLSKQLLDSTSEKVLLTSAASSLASLDRRNPANIKRGEFLEVYKRAISQSDPAVIGIVVGPLNDTTLHYKSELSNIEFLYEARRKLVLPRDFESIEPLERTIAFFEDKPRPVRKNEFNHPIDWKEVRAISKNQNVEIKTDRGVILIRLLIEESPGSVLNFYELVGKKYFDGRFFHRVVPNFVAQAGCNRGDGYGSEDYSIRSEFSLRHYGTGSIGMASSGKDTEGTQWFITHSPTPHLDGRYSLFAEVVSGMEVVNKLEVGDKIVEIKIVQ